MLWCSIAPQHMHTPPNTHTHRCCAMHLCARVAFVLLPTSCPISRAELQYYSVEEEWEEKQEGWRRTGRWVRRHPSLICPSDFRFLGSPNSVSPCARTIQATGRSLTSGPANKFAPLSSGGKQQHLLEVRVPQHTRVPANSNIYRLHRHEIP